MLKHSPLTEKRIEHALERLPASIYPETSPISIEAWHVGGEPVPFHVAQQACYQPFAVGEAWGPEWDTTWFRIQGTVPPHWDESKKPIVLLDLANIGREGFSAEGLVYVDGEPSRAINRNRKDIPVAAKPSESFEFYVEAAANWADPEGRYAAKGTGKLFRLAQAELTWMNPAAFDFFYDFKVAAQAMAVMPANGQRRAELRAALNESLNRLDESDPVTIESAREALTVVLAKKNGDTVHKLSGIGHAHIDTAWLWPLRESIRKCARTFSTALAYMEHYPEYVFGCSQAQQYAWMKAYYPSIYRGIQQRIATGQWEAIGSMWVEVDCNLASGESLIRQILIGKRFFKEEFGIETRDAWVPDVFGYAASMPQIFKKCGIDAFVTQKISWNQFNKFPHHTFLWEGLDGTRIFTHFPPADTYNATVTPGEMLFNANNFLEHGRASRSIYVYGHGDGGGGPDIAMLEQARRLQDLEGFPQFQQERVSEFLPKAIADAVDPAIWVGELYLELHRGTYTTQAAVKKANRASEFLLRDAEFADAVGHFLNPNRDENAQDPPRAIYDVTGLDRTDSHSHQAALDRAWKLLLLNQFHDIIPGSSIAWVYQDAARDYGSIRILGESVLRSSLLPIDNAIDTSGMQKPVRILNTLSWPRREVVTFPDGSLRSVSVPACGYAVVDEGTPVMGEGKPVSAEKSGHGIEMNNGILRLRLGVDGCIESLWDLEAEREAMAAGGGGNLFQLHPDLPNANDAWDIDLFYKEQHTDLRQLDLMEIEEASPLRAVVRIERKFGSSKISQKIVMHADSRRIDFVTEVDWQETHKLLKVAFPVDIRAQQATYEIQFGHLQRPTHFNTSWDMARFEVCAQKWADLSEPGYGVALLNDCKYGYDIHGNTMRLSLLRSPTAPDPTADRGAHSFTYALLPHPGDLRAARVIESAYDLNVPLKVEQLAVQNGSLPAACEFFKIDRPGIVIETIKRAENGEGIVLRLYEAYGARGPAALRAFRPIQRAVLTDMLENEEETPNFSEAEVSLNFRPFEILTLKLFLAGAIGSG